MEVIGESVQYEEQENSHAAFKVEHFRTQDDKKTWRRTIEKEKAEASKAWNELKWHTQYRSE